MVAHEKSIKSTGSSLQKKLTIGQNLQKSLGIENSQTFLIFATENENETDSQNFCHRNRKPLDT